MTAMTRTLLVLLPLLLGGAIHASRGEAGAGAEAAMAAGMIADCSESYFPDPSAPPLGLGAYAAGSGAPAVHRPMRLDLGDLTREAAPEYGDGARHETFEVGGVAYSALVVPRAGTCTRVVIRLNPREIEIATLPSTIAMRNFEVSFVEERVSHITVPAQEANTADVTVYVYEEGEPVIGANVKLWADFRGVPPAGRGRTVAHEHLYDGGDHPPSIRIGERKDDGTADESTFAIRRQRSPLTLVTDNMGEALAKARPRYRGGVESILASARIGGVDYTVATAAVLTILPRLVHFGEYFGREKNYQPSEDFPFYLYGGGPDHTHFFNHFVRSDVGNEAATAFHAIWLADEENRLGEDGEGEGHWLQMNDVSLEYGGQFKYAANANDRCDTPTNNGSHKTHHLGLDFDISACYTGRGGAYVSARQCHESMTQGGIEYRPVISQALLEEYIIGGGRGVIYMHQQTATDFLHYHIRFNPY